jgi:CheY-like chemotaxis protein/HPt (histidine-containing phosphotransfer) domain-containing protein
MRRAKILLVDDNKVNRKLLAAVLEADGHRVEEAASGREAVEGVRLLSYDLVLMDLQMPDMDGVEAAAAIRALGGRGSAVPIVAITGEVDDGVAERCRAAGMNDHLAKPVSPTRLQEVVRSWIAGDQAIGSADVGKQPIPGAETPLGGLAADLSGSALLPIIDDFSAGAGRRAAELESAVAAQQFERARRLAHDLSGSSANLGLMELSRIARSIETACSESDGAAAKRLLADVPSVLSRILGDLAEMRARAAGVAAGPAR